MQYREVNICDHDLLRVQEKPIPCDRIDEVSAGEGINHAGIKRIIELESAMANMAIEVAQLRVEVDALLKENPPKGLVPRRKNPVIVYKEEQ